MPLEVPFGLAGGALGSLPGAGAGAPATCRAPGRRASGDPAAHRADRPRRAAAACRGRRSPEAGTGRRERRARQPDREFHPARESGMKRLLLAVSLTVLAAGLSTAALAAEPNKKEAAASDR